MKTIFLKTATNILLFGFLTSPYVCIGSEPRNGPELSGISIPLKFDKAITETTLFQVNTKCINKYVIYPFLQKISINSSQALSIGEDTLIQTQDSTIFTNTNAKKIDGTKEIVSHSITSSNAVIEIDEARRPRLLVSIGGNRYYLENFTFNSGYKSSKSHNDGGILLLHIEQGFTFSLRPADFDYYYGDAETLTKKLVLKLPVLKYEIAYSEIEDEFGDKTRVPRIKNIRIDGFFSETHPLYNYSTNKAVPFTLNTKDFVSCLKNGIAGEQ